MPCHTNTVVPHAQGLNVITVSHSYRDSCKATRDQDLKIWKLGGFLLLWIHSTQGFLGLFQRIRKAAEVEADETQ